MANIIYKDPFYSSSPFLMPLKYAILTKIHYKDETSTRLHTLASSLFPFFPVNIIDEKDPIEITKNSPREQKKWIELAKLVETVKEKYLITNEIKIRVRQDQDQSLVLVFLCTTMSSLLMKKRHLNILLMLTST